MDMGVFPLMICRSAAEPLGPGCVRGYRCKVCRKELQITPTGQQQIKDMPGVITLCNPCGLALAQGHKAKGTLAGIITSPAAEESARTSPVAAQTKRWLDAVNAEIGKKK